MRSALLHTLARLGNGTEVAWIISTRICDKGGAAERSRRWRDGGGTFADGPAFADGEGWGGDMAADAASGDVLAVALADVGNARAVVGPFGVDALDGWSDDATSV